MEPNSKVILEGYIEILPEELDKVLAELPNHIELTLSEEGCLAFRVEQDSHDKHRFTVYEEFNSELSFELHQRRLGSSKWGMVTKNVQRHYDIKIL